MSARGLFGDSVLLLGGSGMLGRAWSEFLARRGVSCTSPGRGQLDLANPRDIETGLAGHRGLVINCAAWTDVDGAEKNEDTATEINGLAPGQIARCCAECGSTLIHYSSDYVFGGEARVPHAVGDEPAPLGAYGRSKALGEVLVRSSGAQHLIVRTGWLYAPWGRNFVRTIHGRLLRGQNSDVVDDQIGGPTSARHLVETTVRMLRSGLRGIWHVSDGGRCSWFDLAREIAEKLSRPGLVNACATGDRARGAKRPAFSVLDTSETEKRAGAFPGWKHNLEKVLAELGTEAGNAAELLAATGRKEVSS